MMQKIKLMTDSSSDISIEQEKELGIRILCFPVTVEDKGYHERIDFTTEEFYQILQTSPKIPSHAQITTMEFKDTYGEYYKKGYTDLIYVSINSRGSATFNNSVLAKTQFYEENPQAKEHFHIHLIDSKTYSGAYGYAVTEGAKKAQKGVQADEIIAFIKEWVSNVKIYFATYSLEFAKKSGRISAAASFMGELLGLRPILTFIDGKSKILEKVRGDSAVVPKILDLAQANRIPHTPYLLLHGSQADRNDEIRSESEKMFGEKAEGIYYLGATISINSGPKTVGIVIKANPDQ